MRHLIALLVLVVTAAVVAASAQPAPERAFTYRGTVSYVVDGDTIAVRLANGRRERVRLIGIDTPERGACLAAQATAQARRLAHGKRVVLRGDATQDTRDRYGRLLAYAWVGGRDLGYQQVAAGLAQVYVYDRPFQRLSSYRRAEQIGRGRPQNVWRGCAAPPATPPPLSARRRELRPLLPDRVHPAASAGSGLRRPLGQRFRRTRRRPSPLRRQRQRHRL